MGLCGHALPQEFSEKMKNYEKMNHSVSVMIDSLLGDRKLVPSIRDICSECGGGTKMEGDEDLCEACYLEECEKSSRREDERSATLRSMGN